MSGNIMKKEKKHKPSYPDQEGVAYGLHQQLNAILRDLRSIDSLIPAESARTNCLLDPKTQGNEMCIIEGRKIDLLRYIQTICRDHIAWGQPLLDRGWTAEQARKAVPRPPSDSPGCGEIE
jgi:hypothetical protein